MKIERLYTYELLYVYSLEKLFELLRNKISALERNCNYNFVCVLVSVMSQEDSQITTLKIGQISPTIPLSSQSSPRDVSSDNPPPILTDAPPIGQKGGLPVKQIDEDSLVSEAGDQNQFNIQTKLDWTPELDVALLYALQNHKLVGSNKYFHMLCLHEAFTMNSGIRCTVDALWNRVSEWYDLDLLADNEINPFPVSEEPNDFCLPPHFFHSQPHNSPIVLDSGDESTSHRLRSLHRTK